MYCRIELQLVVERVPLGEPCSLAARLALALAAEEGGRTRVSSGARGGEPLLVRTTGGFFLAVESTVVLAGCDGVAQSQKQAEGGEGMCEEGRERKRQGADEFFILCKKYLKLLLWRAIAREEWEARAKLRAVLRGGSPRLLEGVPLK